LAGRNDDLVHAQSDCGPIESAVSPWTVSLRATTSIAILERWCRTGAATAAKFPVIPDRAGLGIIYVVAAKSASIQDRALGNMEESEP
jgi:hypothetical protein